MEGEWGATPPLDLGLRPANTLYMASVSQLPNHLFSVGYIAKGVVYILVGGLTLGTVFGFASGVEGPKGVVKFVEDQPFGNVLVAILGVGLAAYFAWRLYRAIADPTEEGHEPSSVAMRIGYAASGLVYGTLAFLAFKLALGGSGDSSGSGSGAGSSGGGRKEAALAQLLDWPGGKYLIGAIALVVLGVGAYQAYKAYDLTFLKKLNWRGVDRKHVKVSGRWGHVARAIVFAIIAYFLALTALRADADNFRGTEGAIEYLQQHPFGIVMLGLMGAGLMLYGYFAVLKGRYAQVV